MPRRSQSEHDQMVRYVADFLETKRYREVKADIHGYQQPDKITWTATGLGHIPDVTAWGKQFNLFEVETDDSIDNGHTGDQWRLFAAFAEQHKAKFWVVIPEGSRVRAERRLRELGIRASVWEVPAMSYV